MIGPGSDKKEKAKKRPSITSEGTIIEDLGLSEGQSLSENMQQEENGDFSGKNEYATANAWEILPKKSETFQESLVHTGKIGAQCQKLWCDCCHSFGSKYISFRGKKFIVNNTHILRIAERMQTFDF